MLEGRGQLSLALDGWIDVEVAEAAPVRARRALDAGDPAGALAAARAGLEIASLPLLAEFEGPWVDERRRALEETELRCWSSSAAPPWPVASWRRVSRRCDGWWSASRCASRPRRC